LWPITGFRPVLTWTSAADTPQAVRAVLGAQRADPGTWVVPAEATFRRTLACVDPVALAGVLGAWLAARDRPGPGRCPRRATASTSPTSLAASSARSPGLLP
jgi:hypothetical protein